MTVALQKATTAERQQLLPAAPVAVQVLLPIEAFAACATGNAHDKLKTSRGIRIFFIVLPLGTIGYILV